MRKELVKTNFRTSHRHVERLDWKKGGGDVVNYLGSG